MEDSTIIIIAAAVVGYVLIKDSTTALFKPEGMTQQGLTNVNDRLGLRSIYTPDRKLTNIQVGGTVYGIHDDELSQTGFIRRRAWLVGLVPDAIRPQAFNDWVYS